MAHEMGLAVNESLPPAYIDDAGQRYLYRADWERAILAELHALWHATDKAELEEARANWPPADVQALLAAREAWRNEPARSATYRHYCLWAGDTLDRAPDLDSVNID